jgi:hypothetical protein
LTKGDRGWAAVDAFIEAQTTGGGESGLIEAFSDLSSIP